MLVDKIGVYLTKDGDKAYVTETDGYRRCYGYLANTPHIAMSWYTEDGSVRDGCSCGPDFNNALAQRADEALPADAHEEGQKAQAEARKRFHERLQAEMDGEFTPAAKRLQEENQRLREALAEYQNAGPSVPDGWRVEHQNHDGIKSFYVFPPDGRGMVSVKQNNSGENHLTLSVLYDFLSALSDQA